MILESFLMQATSNSSVELERYESLMRRQTPISIFGFPVANPAPYGAVHLVTA